MSITVKLALGSILVGLAVLTLKYLAYYATGSIALYSDALESVINVATAIAAFIAIRISLTPADREHPYGHSKAEYLSAVLEGVLIMLAAFSILREAYFGFLNPEPFEAPLQGLALNGAASLINALWSLHSNPIRTSASLPSPNSGWASSLDRCFDVCRSSRRRRCSRLYRMGST